MLSPKIIKDLCEEFIRFLIDKKELESIGSINTGILYRSLVASARKTQNLKPRIEIRKIKASIIQLALALSTTENRDLFFELLINNSKYAGFHFVAAGSTTIELTPRGINKGTPLIFLTNYYDFMLSKMGYSFEKDDLIDQRRFPTCLVTDADGTLWKKPTSNETYLMQHLEDSPTLKPLKTFLDRGGLLFINSGNDVQRIAAKVREGFKNNPKALSRIGIFGYGGVLLKIFNKNQKTFEIKEYRQNAPHFPPPPLLNRKEFMIYIGDDSKKNGNDWPAFMQLSKVRRICVNEVPREESDSSLQLLNYLPGYEQATAKFLQEINNILQKIGTADHLFADENIQKIILTIAPHI